MSALSLAGLDRLRRLPRPSRADLRRGLVAGAAWGAAMTAAVTALAFIDCGVVCLTDVAVTGAMSLLGGLLAIGPVAIFGRR